MTAELNQIADATACSTHGSSGSPHRILSSDHPLANTFAVGTSATLAAQDAAAEVVGFRLGEAVRVRLARPSPRYEGKSGTVDVLNPADREVHVSIDSASAWFCPSELVPIAATTPIKRARRHLAGPQLVEAGIEEVA